jgi:4-amino-4-deoxy-L-arabinose transferase-like glycosyltransferase
MATLGVPHATGYPLFTILGWLWVQLVPWGEMTTRASLLSAVFGALTVAMIYRLALHLTGRHLAALVGAIALALSYAFWTQTSITEVYTLNTFFLTLVLYLLWQWEAGLGEGQCPKSPHRYLLLAALVYGLSLAHHRLMVLLLPALLIYVWQVDRQVWRNRRLLLRLVLLMGAGLLFYLYVPLREIPQGTTLKESILNTILGTQFSILFGRPIDWLDILWRIPRQQFGYLGLALAAIGAIALAVRQASRKKGIFLLIAYFSTTLFCLVYWIPDPEVFLTPCFVITALWIATGTARVARRVGPRLAPVVEVLAVLAALLLLTNMPQVRAYALAAPGDMEQRAKQILGYDFEPGAIIQADWETATALQYIQAVDNVRPDLTILRLRLGLQSEYERLLSTLDSGQVVYFPHAEGFNLTRFPEVYTLAPVEGLFLRATRSEPDYEEADKVITPQVSLQGYRSGEQNLVLYWRVHEPVEEDYASYVHFFDADLQPLGQADKQAMAEGSYIFPTSHWMEGQVMQDIFVAAPPDTAYVRTGMYTQVDEKIQPLGRAVVFTLRSPSLEEVPNRLNVSLGEQVILWGYEVGQEGESLRLVLYWGSQGRPSQDYTVFVHIVEGEQIVAQRDQQPLAGFYPTSMWCDGEVIRDVYSLPLAPAGAEIRVGLYDPHTMQRLSPADADVDYVIIK